MTQRRKVHPWVYLDNNAITRVDARVLDAMLPFFREHFANPSSEHALGASVSEAVHTARRQAQSLTGASSCKEIVFTSGGTESNNTAIFSALETLKDRDEVITSTVEHPSVLAVCDHLQRTGRAKVHRIPVDRDGRLDEEAYSRALSARTAVVSMQWANNETGTIFPVERLAAMAHAQGALFHCDAVQAAGKVSMQVQSTHIDSLSISAHKMHGPKGVGALYLRNGVRRVPLIHGGRQERGRRAGAENAPAIVGFGVAAELAAHALSREMPRIAALRDRLESEILRSIPGTMVVGSRSDRVPNTLNIAFEDVEADSILSLLSPDFIASSQGSACSSGSIEPSHVLRAMKVPFAFLRGAVRFSFSRENTDHDVQRVLDVLPQSVKDLRLNMVPMEAACDYA
jgi:cysteine desulfurase